MKNENIYIFIHVYVSTVSISRDSDAIAIQKKKPGLRIKPFISKRLHWWNEKSRSSIENRISIVISITIIAFSTFDAKQQIFCSLYSCTLVLQSNLTPFPSKCRLLPDCSAIQNNYMFKYNKSNKSTQFGCKLSPQIL